MSKMKQSVGCGQCGHPTGPAGCTGACFSTSSSSTPISPDELSYSDVRLEETRSGDALTKAHLDDLWSQVEILTGQLKDDPKNKGLATLLSNTVADYNAKLKYYDNQSKPWSK